MKALPALAFGAATFAFVIIPLQFEVAASLLSGAGLMAIVLSDYARTPRRLRVCAPTAVAHPRKERFGLAA
jgi:hypothetical protein